MTTCVSFYVMVLKDAKGVAVKVSPFETVAVLKQSIAGTFKDLYQQDIGDFELRLNKVRDVILEDKKLVSNYIAPAFALPELLVVCHDADGNAMEIVDYPIGPPQVVAADTRTQKLQRAEIIAQSEIDLLLKS